MFVAAAAVGTVGTPVRAGEAEKTATPVPVSSVRAAANCAEVATKVLFVRSIVLFVNVLTKSPAEAAPRAPQAKMPRGENYYYYY